MSLGRLNCDASYFFGLGSADALDVTHPLPQLVLTGDGGPFADGESLWLKPARGKIK